ncbi:hypothetical protein KDA23_07770, partial [Candidatus Saccharibacteria bacterium]|nr:hypothetical protein [Candidatus Saccharibacteria bacterium]
FTQIETTTPASPEYYPVLMAMGTKNPTLPPGVHCIGKATAAGSAGDGFVTAVKIVQQDGFSAALPIMAHRDTGGQGIDKPSTTYGTSILRFFVNVGRKFSVPRIRLNFANAVAANMTITPKLFFDNFSSSSTDGLTVINNTNYAASERFAEFTPALGGEQNMVLELRWSGSALLPILLPIEIDLRIETD